MRASYLASLFEAQKPNLSDFSNRNPSGDIITTPTLDPLALDAPSIYTRHDLTETWHISIGAPGAGVNSATNFANTYHLMEFLGLYRMLNVPSLVPHLASLPVKFGLLKSDCKGYLVSTHTVYA